MSRIDTVRNKLLNDIEEQESALQIEMVSYYKVKSSDVRKEIASFFMMFGTNNKVDYRNTMLPLPTGNKSSLYERVKNFTEQYQTQEGLVPNLDSIHKLNRLDGLRAICRIYIMEIGAYEIDRINSMLSWIYATTYEETSKVIGVSYNESELNDKAKSLNASENIFANCNKLAKYIELDIAQGIVRGCDFVEIADTVCNRIERVSKNDFDRLMYTVDTEAFDEAQAEIFEKKYNNYMYVTQQDEKVCPVCRDMDRKVFSFEEREIGVNFPPLHPWCRCVIKPV